MAMPIQRTSAWTLEQLHRLPDDGNRYELIHGELFVTPAPSDGHQAIATVLNRILVPYVTKHRLGYVVHPRSIVRVGGSEVEPDLMVRPGPLAQPDGWDAAPLPILVVEILSGVTVRRDRMQKRAFYLEIGVPEYWIVDRRDRTVRVVRPDRDDEVCTGSLTWQPASAADSLVIDVAELYREALGDG
jgi:Uma2 family endonuclease